MVDGRAWADESGPGRSPRPATCSASGVVLVTACTGSNPFVVPGDRAEPLRNVLRAQPDLSTVPERLRPIVARCLAKKPVRRPAPAQFLDALMPVRPSVRPWPDAVHRLIARQHADLDRLLNPSPVSTAALGTGPTLVAPDHSSAHHQPVPATGVMFEPTPTPTPTPTRRTSRSRLPVRRTALVMCALVALALAVAIPLRFRLHGGGGFHALGARTCASTHAAPPSGSTRSTSATTPDQSDQRIQTPITCMIQANNTGNYLTAVDGGGRQTDVLHTDTTHVGEWERFTLVDSGDDNSTVHYGIRTNVDTYLTAEDGGGRSTGAIRSDATRIQDWEMFRITCVDT